MFVHILSEVKNYLTLFFRTQINPTRDTQRLHIGQCIGRDLDKIIFFTRQRQYFSKSLIVDKCSILTSCSMQIVTGPIFQIPIKYITCDHSRFADSIQNLITTLRMHRTESIR
ncbi:hypothetical protein D3C87_1345410 [compost metagenome]